MTFEPLGDQAVLVRCDDEAQAFALAAAVRQDPPAGMVDLVQAYRSVAVYYDLASDYSAVAADLQRLHVSPEAPQGQLVRIPCCYEMGLDLEWVAGHLGKSCDEVVALHTGAIYTVYAVGFSPGFPYLGYLPPELSGVPRRSTPRVRVEPGSVGIAANQTGIYPQATPAGWQLIGRTPVKILDLAAGFFRLMPGDQVQFHGIRREEFDRLYLRS